VDDLSKIQAKFTLGLELVMQAWNELLAYQKPATSLHPTFGVVISKAEAAR
jgi:hypothetical protein